MSDPAPTPPQTEGGAPREAAETPAAPADAVAAPLMGVDASTELAAFMSTRAPYAALPREERAELIGRFQTRSYAAGAPLYAAGEALEGLYLIAQGRVAVSDAAGALLSLLGPGNSFGERGLMRDGGALTSARAETEARVHLLPAAEFTRLRGAYPDFERFFERSRPSVERPTDLSALRVSELMTPDPLTCAGDATVGDVARIMRDAHVSCVFVVDGGALSGIVTNRDLTARVLAEELPATTPIRQVMTEEPAALGPDALGGDILFEMLDRGVGHLPVVDDGALVGVVTQTDLTRRQATTSATLVREIFASADVEEMAGLVGRIPSLLAQLVGAGHRHEVVTRLITDIADAATRKLLRMAEAELGAPPVPYLWLACGSQGRREQTGVSDQDNCLFLADAATEDDMVYFESLAAYVTAGLDTCGYVLCPGDMMASNPRWRQPIRVWREYFDGWIAKPDPTAQMLASVMFDLRPIAGDSALFDTVIDGVLERASGNSIFVAHMIRNAVGHHPPLGLFGGVATIRSGEHKETVDLKHNGVAPVVDLGRIYAIKGALRPANTRARLEAGVAAQVVSASGGHDLIDAYDLIAETRLRHQAQQAKTGAKIDNFMHPSDLSDLERSHLRDAFVVVRTMQSALSHGHASLM